MSTRSFTRSKSPGIATTLAVGGCAHARASSRGDGIRRRPLTAERHRLAGREYPHLRSGRDACRFPRELSRRIAKGVRPEPRERVRIERAPVDGDGDPRPDPPDRFGCALWIEMARPESRPPTPDRQKGDVDRTGETVHLGA